MFTSTRFVSVALVLVAVAVAVAVATVGYAQAAAQAGPTDAASLGLNELTDDLSRQQLFQEIQAADRKGNAEAAARAEDATQQFNLVGPFRFPGDTTYDSALNQPRKDSFFGVDISHYTASGFPIELLRIRNVQFLYMKATQGASGLDGKFSAFWKRAGGLPKGKQVHRGAYHFLTACQGTDCQLDPGNWGKKQADTFVKVIKANGGLLPTDMPPVVDLEWDKATGTAPDRWENYAAKDIASVVDAFVTEVSTQLQRTPMIYTTRAWWNERMKAMPMTATMKKTPLWLADYSKSSRASEVPRTIGGAQWDLWQFTDSGTMATGFNESFDSNIYKGSLPALYKKLGVEEFSG